MAGSKSISWREFWKVHPAADLFPMMTEAELDALSLASGRHDLAHYARKRLAIKIGKRDPAIIAFVRQCKINDGGGFPNRELKMEVGERVLDRSSPLVPSGNHRRPSLRIARQVCAPCG